MAASFCRIKRVNKLTGFLLVLASVSLYLNLRKGSDGRVAVMEIRSSSEANDYTESLARRAHLRQVCREMGYPDNIGHSKLRAHMNPDQNVLYCRINKCASTFNLNVLSNVFNCNTECLVQNGHDVLSSPNAGRRLSEAFSFIFIREPYRRLFSTYGNLFYMPKEDWVTRGSRIINGIRFNASASSRKYGHDLTFSEMIRYVVEFSENGKKVDEHMRPMSHVSCDPCLFDFDFIGKVETMESDWKYLIQNWTNSKIITGVSSLMLNNSKHAIKDSYGPVKHAFNLKQNNKYLPVSNYSLLLRLWTFYQMTGVISKKFSMPFNEKVSDGIETDDFIKEVKEATERSARMGEEVKLQREEAMFQAYRTVPMEYMERLRKTVYKDCLLFGYDDRPALLFDRSFTPSFTDGFDYFKGL